VSAELVIHVMRPGRIRVSTQWRRKRRPGADAAAIAGRGGRVVASAGAPWMGAVDELAVEDWSTGRCRRWWPCSAHTPWVPALSAVVAAASDPERGVMLVVCW